MSETAYDFNWLKERGFFKDVVEEQLNEKIIKMDKSNLIAYVEISQNENVEQLKRDLLDNYSMINYIWFFSPDTKKIRIYRKIGEIKWFYYSSSIKYPETRKSKEEKLAKFSPENIGVLFDTRDVVNKFYLELSNRRIQMAESVKKLKDYRNKLLVVQHLIDRLIFFYFLGQLKLVKIKHGNGKEWILDRKNTREFLGWIIEKLEEHEVQKFLNTLFFDVLGNVTPAGFASKEFKISNERFFIESPCLDGGLFVEHGFEGIMEREIPIEGIKEFINVLNNYNWIIGEEIPEEEDVVGELTPEIIGHIYEKFVISLEEMGIDKIKLQDLHAQQKELKYGRKKRGAYYTPEEITKYISENTIGPFIQDKLGQKFGKNGEVVFNSLKEDKKEEFNKDELDVIKYLYFEVLTKIKICDNACGSASFLVAAGDILLGLYSRVLKILEENLSNDAEVKKVLEDASKAPTRNYYIVREIIVNNLYGVDIMEGAIEIAKLRLWLWLVSQVTTKEVAEKKIETLPNLDFNLMVGNSLVGFIDIEELQFDFLKQKLLFEKPPEKKEWLKSLVKKKQEFKTLPTSEALKLKKELNEDLENAREFLNGEFYTLLRSKGIKLSEEEFQALRPFHWGFEFSEVFDLNKPKEERGFDIIIGNPPYINIYNLGEKEREIYTQIFSFAYKKYDIYILFIERSINTINKDGEFSYITSDKWIAEEYGYKLREFFLNKKILREVVDFRDYPVFVGVGIRNVIFFLSKTKVYNKIFVKNFNFQLKNLLPYKIIETHPRYHLRLDLKSTDLLIITEILRNSIKISEICYVNWGCRPSPSDKYTFNSFEECRKRVRDNKELCKRLIKGANIGRYFFTWGGKWLAYLPGMYNPLFPELFESDRIIIKDIGVKPLTATLIKGKEKFYSDNTTINLIKFDDLPANRKNNLTNSLWYSKNINIKFPLLLINSKLINYFIITFLSDQLHVFPENTKNIPIKLTVAQSLFILLCDYMLFLNTTEERRTKEKETMGFLDKQIIDSIVYELYFKEKFKEDGLYPESEEYLLELVSKYLKPINYDRYSDLYWKTLLGGDLGENEKEELKNLEVENLEIIKEVVEKLKNDKEVIKQIEKIKSHEWVKIVESGSV